MLAFADIWTNWTCTAEVYGFLTCQANAEVDKVLATDGANVENDAQRTIIVGLLLMVSATWHLFS